ncbi:conserved hypothetical phage protein [Acinetobacter phage Acj61]|uniref:Conserved hypothetical phage protein n=1 Tax=Acinetobacter phage Acj61 TaxID=760732 RepID=E5E460_9CAUD|nr:hypothetical protein Acj61p079 [Acinetobacter phage Acj61]ADG36044.1 conserved hypothetical phage protein [Acinetobacter phage Acj61]
MRKLIVPIFSMRSYETGLYSVLKDGNFQLHLSRARAGDVITIPTAIADYDELKELFPEFVYIQVPYMTNAFETRRSFWNCNRDKIAKIITFLDCDIVVTDITGYFGKIPIIFNFNITADPENPRAYIDGFLQTDVASVILSQRTFVLNQCQKDVLVENGAPAEKIVVCQKVVSPEIIDRYLGDAEVIHIGDRTIFHPFRISDKCYDFDAVVEKSMELKNGAVFVTDPNDTFDRSKYPERAVIHNIKLSKQDYYRVLIGQPKIIYNENPQKVFHPGLAELIYFDADIESEYIMPLYEDVVIENGEDVWLS